MSAKQLGNEVADKQEVELWERRPRPRAVSLFLENPSATESVTCEERRCREPLVTRASSDVHTIRGAWRSHVTLIVTFTCSLVLRSSFQNFGEKKNYLQSTPCLHVSQLLLVMKLLMEPHEQHEPRFCDTLKRRAGGIFLLFEWFPAGTRSRVAGFDVLVFAFSSKLIRLSSLVCDWFLYLIDFLDVS